MEELRKLGVGRSATRGSATAPSGTALPSSGDAVPEIRETPRGVVITLPMAHFAFDRADLDAEARWVVGRIAVVLNHPRAQDRKVVLEGYADYIGTQAYNLALSRRRAETVARELIGQGVRRDRLSIEAYGESRPIAPNKNRDGTDNPAGRARNRRVEAVIQS
jgi:outer membrane protein OmpA-like peptidoglycan-associated protein